jgi:UrcA family protein
MTKLALLGAAVFLASPAVAGEPVVVVADETPLPAEMVSFADLNLGSTAGQNRLVQRIRGAADHVCSDADKTGIEFLVYRGCFNTAVGNGIVQMQQVMAARKSGSPLAATALVIRAK